MSNLRVVTTKAKVASNPLESVLGAVRESLVTQAEAVAKLATRVDEGFLKALGLIVGCKGRLIVCGIGKSGLIGRKVAATFACSGTPSFFLHPAEAAHGDLGMITSQDVLLLISNSGETQEIVRLLPFLQEQGVPLIAIVGRPGSTMGRAADAVVDVSVDREACPHNLVPTTSAMTTLAMGDALAMAAMRVRDFSADDFGRFHPGGSLGRKLNSRVRDIMQTNPLPLALETTPVAEMLMSMTGGRCGLVVVVNENRQLRGIVTDGDLRRALQMHKNLLQHTVSDIMTTQPVAIHESASVREADERMRRLRIKALVVVNDDNQVCGIAEIFHSS
jgi:arabinose-5-phosphate isomerase